MLDCCISKSITVTVLTGVHLIKHSVLKSIRVHNMPTATEYPKPHFFKHTFIAGKTILFVLIILLVSLDLLMGTSTGNPGHNHQLEVVTVDFPTISGIVPSIRSD